MDGKPVSLDSHRGMAAQTATDLRRADARVVMDQQLLRRSQARIERALLARPAKSWREAVDRATYLISLLTASVEGRDPRRRRIAAAVINDFAGLLETAPDGPGRQPPPDGAD